MRDHGGNIDRAISTYGGDPADWIDLSTGINRVPYPLPPVSDAAWTQLPTRAAMARLTGAAARAYGTSAAILPVAGAQAAIQMIPRLTRPGRARVLAPTYNEHAASLRAAGWMVEEVSDPAEIAGADLGIIVNPNNPDGRSHDPASLVALSRTTGRLIIDESFADPRPDLSAAPLAGSGTMLILRSFGKFYGLAGLRLGFILGPAADIAALAEMAGPWPISGAAIEIGATALQDSDWAQATITRLTGECDRIDALARGAGWASLGGGPLFRLYDTPDALAAQDRLAKARIWSRCFPYSARWLRLGLPGSVAEWDRLSVALSA